MHLCAERLPLANMQQRSTEQTAGTRILRNKHPAEQGSIQQDKAASFSTTKAFERRRMLSGTTTATTAEAVRIESARTQRHRGHHQMALVVAWWQISHEAREALRQWVGLKLCHDGRLVHRLHLHLGGPLVQ